MVFNLSALWWRRIRGLWKLPDGRHWLGLLLIGGAEHSKSLIQFSDDGRGCVHSLLFDLKPKYGGVNEDNGDLLQKVPCSHCCTRCPQPCSRPPPTHTSAVDSWTFTSKSRSVSCWLINKRLLLSMSSERSIVSCYSPVLSRWQWWLVFSKSIIRGNLESLSVFLFLCIGRVNGDLCRMKFSISALQCISPRWNLAP